MRQEKLRVTVTVRIWPVLRICGVAFVLACLSTLYPAWRAARLLPAESLRND